MNFKLNDEAILRLITNIVHLPTTDEKLLGNITTSLKELLSLRRENRWIPVSEELPKHNKSVLIRCESYNSDYNGGYEIASYMTSWEEPRWSIGKQQTEPEEVLSWRNITK